MPHETTTIQGDITFKLRFNTMHGDTDYFWRVIIITTSPFGDSSLKEGGELEYLAKSIHCKVETWSDASFDERAGAIKYHMAGRCAEFIIDEFGAAFLRY